MQSFIIRGIIIILLFLPLASVQALVMNQAWNSTGVTSSSGGSLFWYMNCSYGTVIDRIEQFNIDSIGTLANVDIKLNGAVIFSTTSVPSAGSGLFATVDFNDYACPEGWNTIELDVLNATTVTVRNVETSLTPNVYLDYPVAIVTSTTTYTRRLSGTIFYSLPTINVTSGTSSSMSATTTVITTNDQLIQFFILFCFMFMMIFGIIMLVKPFYVRK